MRTDFVKFKCSNPCASVVSAECFQFKFVGLVRLNGHFVPLWPQTSPCGPLGPSCVWNKNKSLQFECQSAAFALTRQRHVIFHFFKEKGKTCFLSSGCYVTGWGTCLVLKITLTNESDRHRLTLTWILLSKWRRHTKETKKPRGQFSFSDLLVSILRNSQWQKWIGGRKKENAIFFR